MSSTQILVLGAVAGATIFIGLPLGRLSDAERRACKAALSATATGILLFLLYDVIHGAIEPVDEALDERGRRRQLGALRLVRGALRRRRRRPG